MSTGGVGGPPAAASAAPDPLWVECIDGKGRTFFFHPFSGRNEWSVPAGGPVRIISEAAYKASSLAAAAVVLDDDDAAAAAAADAEEEDGGADDWVAHEGSDSSGGKV